MTTLVTRMFRSLLLLAMAGAVAGAAEFHDASGARSAKSRQEWIAIMGPWLKSCKVTPQSASVEFGSSERSHEGTYTHYANKDGLIRFPTGEWALVATHSAHCEEGRTRLIGDISLAWTSHGELFENPGHVCSHLILKSDTRILSLDTFLATKGLVSKGDAAWRKVDIQMGSSAEREGLAGDRKK